MGWQDNEVGVWAFLICTLGLHWKEATDIVHNHPGADVSSYHDDVGILDRIRKESDIARARVNDRPRNDVRRKGDSPKPREGEDGPCKSPSRRRSGRNKVCNF